MKDADIGGHCGFSIPHLHALICCGEHEVVPLDRALPHFPVLVHCSVGGVRCLDLASY